MLLGLKLRHREQVVQVIKPVLLGKPGQVSDGVGDKARRLVRVPIARRLARE